MAANPKHFYEFGPFRIDASERTLSRGDQIVPMTPKVFDILLALVRNRGETVDKATLMKDVWPDSFVEEGNLTVHMTALRRALGERPDDHSYIQTVPRRGYRFVAEVTENWVHDRGPGSSKRGPGLKAAVRLPLASVESPNAPAPARAARKRKFVALPLAAVVIGAAVLAAYYHGRPASRRIDSIAVVPFANATGEPASEYLIDGITEDLIDDLARLPETRVIARDSVFHFKGNEGTAQQIGKELGVAAVLGGRITREGDMLILRTELVNVADAAQLWGGRYSHSANEVATVHEEITRDIMAMLHREPLNREQHHIVNEQAYDLYLKARFYLHKTPTLRDRQRDFAQSIAYLQQAVDEDPQFAEAYAELASAYVYSKMPQQWYQLAEQAALMALRFDPSLGVPHAALARMKTSRFQWQEAAEEYRKAIELSPNNSDLRRDYAFDYLVQHKEYMRAVQECKKAIEIDPVTPVHYANLGFLFFYMGKHGEAIQSLQRALEIDPELYLAHLHLAQVYASENKYDEAAAEWVKAYPGFSFPTTHLNAEAFWQTLLTRGVGPTFSADAYAVLGKKEEAFASLEKAYKEQRYLLPHLIRSPFLDDLRSEPPYLELMKNMSLPP